MGYDSENERFTAGRNKSRSTENMALSYSQRSRPVCKIESNVTTGRQKEIDCFSVDGFFVNVTLFLKLWGVNITTAPVKKHVLF